jgi:SAM-dependent methyltransferase
MRRFLSPKGARRFYDLVGSLEDSQAFYEDPALKRLIREGRFDSAASVFEFGCGTGRLAERLLRDELPDDARYTACDISPKMVALAGKRLERFGPRARVFEHTGALRSLFGEMKFNRIVTSYVLDLLPEDQIEIFMEASRDALAPGGFLCAASIAPGAGFAASTVSSVWSAIHRISPVLTGGCRPVDLPAMFAPEQWSIAHSGTVAAWGVTSCVVVASPR